MNLSLTMNFASLEEMQLFLNRNETSTSITPIIPITPTPDLTEQTMDDPEIELVPEETALEGVLEPEVDLVALRAETMDLLKAKAGAMDDPSVLGAFITGFGVKKFSELDDDMLVPFKAAFVAEFGA